MQNLEELIIVPIQADQSTLFIRAHSQILKLIQRQLYAIAIKMICVPIVLVSMYFLNCGFDQIDSWCLLDVIAQFFYLAHYKNFKKHLVNTEQMLNISMVLEGQFSQTQLNQPLPKDINQMITKIGKSMWILNPDMLKKYKYLLIIRQIMIMIFIFILEKLPFKAPYLYFYGNCNDSILNMAFYCFIALLIKSLRFYELLIRRIITIPQILMQFRDLLYAKLKSKIVSYLLLRRVRNQFYQFNTFQYQAELHQECSICMADYELGDTIIKLPCNANHIFHKRCIKEWLQISVECPMCRQSIIDGSLNFTHI